MKRVVVMLAVLFCFISVNAHAGALVDWANKVETRWAQIKDDNKDVKRTSDWVDKKAKELKKQVNEKTK
jgi:hypothetical protein